MAEEAASTITTWHCLCSALVLATPYELDQLPRRASPGQDHAIILPFAAEGSDPESSAVAIPKSTLHNLTPDRKPLIVRREDGFEKRVPLHCTRCKLIVAYRVFDDSGKAPMSNIFLLPGGLMRTEDMKLGKVPQPPAWAAQDG